MCVLLGEDIGFREVVTPVTVAASDLCFEAAKVGEVGYVRAVEMDAVEELVDTVDNWREVYISLRGYFPASARCT